MFDLTRVTVHDPNSAQEELEKDFNVNAYSGEVTRRWVLYGPPGQGLPIAGQYRFTYYQDDQQVLEQVVDYEPESVYFPKNVTWRREASDLVVRWTPQ